MQDAKEEVRDRLNIEDVIGEYVRLSRAGRSMKGLSPFTQEKTPSFMVSPDKHVWYDFSSNRGGDVFSFVMEMEGLGFRETLELLARKAGVDLGHYKSGGKDLTAKKQRLTEALSLAAQYYQQTLLKNVHALDYVVKKRKMNKKSIQDFQIGFAPDSQNAAVTFLAKKGFTSSEIKEAGMANQRGGDLFRSRVMVPLKDSAGQIIGFTGRFLGEQTGGPKYLNTPQTLLYDKSRHVFGLDLAKQAIRTKHQAIIVEGNLDVVASHQAGVENVVAAAGTALTEQHLRIIKRLSSRISLAFDSDKAGIAATERAIGLSQIVDVELRVIDLPGNAKDPDELIKLGAELWSKAIEQASPAVDWLIEEYLRRHDIATASGKRAFTSASLSVIKSLKDPVETEHYLGVVAQKSQTSLEAVTAKLNTITTDTSAEKKLRKGAATTNSSRQPNNNEDALVGLALLDFSVRGLLVEIDESELSSDQAKLLLSFIKSQPEADFSQSFPPDLQAIETYGKINLLKAEERYSQWSQLDRYDQAARLVRLVKYEIKQRKKQTLQEKLQRAELAGDQVVSSSLRQQLNDVIKEMAHREKPSTN